jgi:hypothetical protein
LAEEQLQDGRGWVANTVIPGVADATLFIFVDWYMTFKEVRDTISFENDYPKLLTVGSIGLMLILVGFINSRL